MKRINLLLAIVVAVLVTACSEPSLEEIAMKRVKPLTEIMVDDPQSLIIQDIRTVYSNDSICALQYLAKSRNANNAYQTDTMEYVVINISPACAYSVEPGLYEEAYSVSGANRMQSVLDNTAFENLSKFVNVDYSDCKNKEDSSNVQIALKMKESKDAFIYYSHVIRTQISEISRKVPE